MIMAKNKDMEYTHQVMRSIADAVDEILKEMVGPGFVLTILVYPENKPGIANYISTGQREDMIKALRETADRIEANEDIRPGVNDN